MHFAFIVTQIFTNLLSVIELRGRHLERELLHAQLDNLISTLEAISIKRLRFGSSRPQK